MNRAAYLAEAESYRQEALQVLRNRKVSYDGRHYEFALAIYHAHRAMFNALRLRPNI